MASRPRVAQGAKQRFSIAKAVESGRLAFYQTKADSTFWDTQWQEIISPELFHRYATGCLDFFDRPFRRYLPKDGRVLEAGCGTGKYVVALRALGYECVGVDYAESTIQAIRCIDPTLPVHVGDVGQLDFENREFKAVISLGVVEHVPEGPERLLLEMRRVLAADGTLLVSVPSFNALRRAKARCGAYSPGTHKLDFYQWAFHPRDFRSILTDTGFRIVNEYEYDYQKTLRDELAFVQRLPLLLRASFLKGAGYLPLIRSHCGHMRLFIAARA